MEKQELIAKLVAGNPELQEAQYKALIVAEIRKRYTVDDESAIIRKKLAGLDDGEFDVYNKYVESCKAKVKELLQII